MPRIDEILSPEAIAEIKGLENGEAVLTKVTASAGSDLLDNREGKFIDKTSGLYFPKAKFDLVNNELKQYKETIVPDLKTAHGDAITTLEGKLSTQKLEFDNKLTASSKLTVLKGVFGKADKLGGSFMAPELATELLTNDAEFMGKVVLNEDGTLKDEASVIEAIKTHSKVSQLITKGKAGGAASGGGNGVTNITDEELTTLKTKYDEAKKAGNRAEMMKLQSQIMNKEAELNEK